MRTPRSIFIVVACSGAVLGSWIAAKHFDISPWLIESDLVITKTDPAGMIDPKWRYLDTGPHPIICGVPFQFFNSHTILTNVADELDLDVVWKMPRNKVLQKLKDSISQNDDPSGRIIVSIRAGSQQQVASISASLVRQRHKFLESLRSRNYQSRDEDWAKAIESQRQKTDELIKFAVPQNLTSIDASAFRTSHKEAEDLLQEMISANADEVALRNHSPLSLESYQGPSDATIVGINTDIKSVAVFFLVMIAPAGISVLLFLWNDSYQAT